MGVWVHHIHQAGMRLGRVPCGTCFHLALKECACWLAFPISAVKLSQMDATVF